VNNLEVKEQVAFLQQGLQSYADVCKATIPSYNLNDA
jgi:hypothetical protein